MNIDFDLIIERLEALRDNMTFVGGSYCYDAEEAAREEGMERGYENARDDVDSEISTLRKLIEEYNPTELAVKTREFAKLMETDRDDASERTRLRIVELAYELMEYRYVLNGWTNGWPFTLTERGKAVLK